MILVDTSVWVDHLRRRDPVLSDALENGEVAVHPFVIGELACGTLPDRAALFRLLEELPAAPLAAQPERRRLMGKGLGYVDAHLLASTLLAAPESMRLWTRDLALEAAANSLGIAYRPGSSDLH